MKICMMCGFSWKIDLEFDSDDCPMCKWKAGIELVINNNMKLQALINRVNGRNAAAIDVLETYRDIKVSDQKSWVIDQALRALMGKDIYKNFRKDLKEHRCDWDEGEAP